jgi:nucleoside-diphosphate-sugar epimerase
MDSDLQGGVNIGHKEYVTVDELARVVMRAAGKNLKINHVPGPVGVSVRRFTNSRIESTGWRSNVSLEQGIKKTYDWILGQVKNGR